MDMTRKESLDAIRLEQWQEQYADFIQEHFYTDSSYFMQVFEQYCIENVISDDEEWEHLKLFELEQHSGITHTGHPMHKIVGDLAWKIAHQETDLEFLREHFNKPGHMEPL